MGKLIFPEINLNGIKGVLLDIDNTIYHYDSCHEHAFNTIINELSKMLNLSKDIIQKEFLNSRKKINTDLFDYASSHSRFLYIQITLEKCLKKTLFKETLKLEEVYWSAFLSKMQIEEGAKKFINKCYELNLPICCVTDLTSQIQFRKIIQLKLEDKINFIVTSEEAGIEKPNKKIFDLALKKINLKYDEAIMIGDNNLKDIKGAEDLGIRSYLVKSL